MDCPSLLFFEQAFRFPTRQTLIDEFDGQTNLLADALGKACRFVSHFSTRAVEAEGEADDDLLDPVLAGDFSQPAHIFVAVDAVQCCEWTSEARVFFRQREADARTTVVNRENGSALACAQ